jgi:hypothetical protein
MSKLRRFLPVILAAMIAGALACGGDSTGPKAGSVTGVFGDNGSVPTGGTLNIGFTVLGADGFPLRGVRVTWAVTPTSAGTVNPSSQTSDSAGAIAAVVTAGSTVGAFTVTGNVNGVAPIAFHVTVLDPCQSVALYSLGDTVSGALARTDCKVVQGPAFYFYDYYKLDLPAGQNSIRVSMSSTTFDTYVDLYSFTTGRPLGSDDDVQPGVIQNSQLDIILGQGGSYVIGANSYDPDTVGAYKLVAVARATTLSGCQDTWTNGTVTIVDTVRTDDCAISGSYFDYLWFYARAGAVLQFAERSAAMNPLLKLYHVNFNAVPQPTLDSILANDDSSAGNTNAYISYAVPADGLYQLRMGTAAAGTTGEYTLVSTPTGQSTTAGSAPVLPDILRLLQRAPKGWKAKQ